MGESDAGVPAVVFRGIPPWTGHDDLFWRDGEDLIREALCRVHGVPPIR